MGEKTNRQTDKQVYRRTDRRTDKKLKRYLGNQLPSDCDHWRSNKEINRKVKYKIIAMNTSKYTKKCIQPLGVTAIDETSKYDIEIDYNNKIIIIVINEIINIQQ